MSQFSNLKYTDPFHIHGSTVISMVLRIQNGNFILICTVHRFSESHNYNRVEKGNFFTDTSVELSAKKINEVNGREPKYTTI